MTIDHNEWLHQIALSIFLRAFINYSAGPQWCCCGCFNRTLLGNRAVWIRVFQPIAVESNLSLKHTMNFMHWSTNTSITFPVQYLPSGKDANIHYNFFLLLSNCLRLNGCERLARFFLLAEFYIPRFRLKLLFFFSLFCCLYAYGNSVEEYRSKRAFIEGYLREWHNLFGTRTCYCTKEMLTEKCDTSLEVGDVCISSSTK